MTFMRQGLKEEETRETSRHIRVEATLSGWACARASMKRIISTAIR